MDGDIAGVLGTVLLLRFRSDNSIKNHFFSKLRMSVRHLNKKLSERDLVGKPRSVKMHVLYKIMSVCEERFKHDSPYTEEFIEFSYSKTIAI